MKSCVCIGLDVGSVSVKMAVLLPKGDSRWNALLGTGVFFLPEDGNRLNSMPDCDSENINGLPEYGGTLNHGPDPNSSTGRYPLALPEHTLLLSRYARHRGNPQDAASELFDTLTRHIYPGEIVSAATGSGAKAACERGDFRPVHDFQAISRAMSRLYPGVRTVFELGGERSRYLLLSGRDGRILDYGMNGECAAGTGAFFDQQAARLKIPVEEAGALVLSAPRTASIAGRCSVFAKSDMIHAQQRGYAPAEVLKGLCEAVVRNFKGNITKGKAIEPRVALVGGVAANRGVEDAFRRIFEFHDGDFFVPSVHAWIGAIGAGLHALDDEKKNTIVPAEGAAFSGMKDFSEESHPSMPPLSLEKVKLLRDRVKPYAFPEKGIVDAWLGIDIGSVSTNLALIDEYGELIYGIYRMTEGRPVGVVKDSLLEMQAAAGEKVRIRGAGTTGSGRELIGLLVGADVIKDEITAHKTGAMHAAAGWLSTRVDTIFEVGGQDSKFISIHDGAVVDFALNEACAAGTGSFLEAQAGQMDISIRGEFSELALRSRNPLKLGERCTVFMEKELIPYLQKGVPKEDIAAGLAYSVVLNYLNKVVKRRKIGDVVFFQGGTAYNDSVAAAFSTVLKKEIIVPPHNGIIGAIGAALLAAESGTKATAFRGWNLDRVDWRLREFTCRGCSNECTVQEFDVQGEKSYWGDKCSEKYRKRTRTAKKAVLPDLVTVREKVLSAGWTRGSGSGREEGSRDSRAGNSVKVRNIRAGRLPAARGSVGIPMALSTHARLPFWKTYFESLGFEAVISSPSRKKLIDEGIASTVAEPCFPIQAAHGHIADLARKDVDFLFIPNLVNEEGGEEAPGSFICPWVQTLPLVARHTPAFLEWKEKILCPNILFRNGVSFVEERLAEEMARLGIRPSENRVAVRNAFEAQEAFSRSMADEGKKVLSRVLECGKPCVVLLGRPYALYDSGLNLNIPAQLRDLYGIDVIPMDFLPLDGIDVRPVHDHMFWHYGRRILQAARFIRDHDTLHPVVLSHFKCGPDSYIRHYIGDAAGKPFLFLQLDSHSNDAGVMTRIEAFLESRKMM